MLSSRGERLAWGALALVVLLVGATWLGGGFRVSERYIPEASLHEPLDLSIVTFTVDEVVRTNLDSTGKVRTKDPKEVIQVRGTAVLQDRKARYFSLSNMVEVSPAGTVQMLASARSGRESAELQPGIARPLVIEFVATTAPGERVDVLIGAPSYEWSNLINWGPEWSSSRARWAGAIEDIVPTDAVKR